MKRRERKWVASLCVEFGLRAFTSMTAASRLSVKHGRVAHVRRGRFRPGSCWYRAGCVQCQTVAATRVPWFYRMAFRLMQGGIQNFNDLYSRGWRD